MQICTLTFNAIIISIKKCNVCKIDLLLKCSYNIQLSYKNFDRSLFDQYIPILFLTKYCIILLKYYLIVNLNQPSLG